MHISEVRIKLMSDPQERLLAFCSVTFDGCFVIRDLKLIQGLKGAFVAMPSRKLTDHCSRCSGKNNLRAMYCQQCGLRLSDNRAIKGLDGRARLYADIAHPINSDCRDRIQEEVSKAFERELVLSQQPDYVSRYDDLGEDMYESVDHHFEEAMATTSVSVTNSQGETRRLDSPAAPPVRAPHRNAPQRHPTEFSSPRLTNTEFGDGIL